MPEMSGVELWKHLRDEVSPDCKVLFMSGESLQDHVRLPGELLQKPFSLRHLKEKLAALGTHGE